MTEGHPTPFPDEGPLDNGVICPDDRHGSTLLAESDFPYQNLGKHLAAESLRTTPALARLMAEADEMQQQKPGMVTLLPTLTASFGHFALRLSVTDGQSSYTVKSIGQLIQRVAAGQRYAYGKKLEFVHGPAAFDTRSQKLLYWLMEELGEGSSLEDPLPDEGDDEGFCQDGRPDDVWEEPWSFDGGEYYGNSQGSSAGWERGAGNSRLSGSGATARRSAASSGWNSASLPNRTMKLSPQQLVGFLKTQAGQRIDLDCDDYSRPRKGSVEVGLGAPADLDLVDIREVEGGFELSSLWDFSGVVCASGCAILVDDGFYVTGPEFAPIAQLLHAMTDDGGRLLVAREDAPLFGATLLQPLEKQLGIKPPEALLRYRPAPLQLQFSFDVQDGAIQVDAQALYGQRAIALAISPASLPGAMEQAPDGQPIVVGISDGLPPVRDRSFYRNKAAESQALQLLLTYFPPTGVLPLASDVAAAGLLLHGLTEFRALGEVFTTPAFNRLIRPRPPRLQLGLSLAGNLIALDVSADDMELPELLALLDSYRRRRAFHRLSDGTFISLHNFDDKGLSQLMADMGISAEDVLEGRVQLPTYQAFYLENELDGVYRDAGFLEFVGQFRAPDPATLLPVPASLQGVLRPYQEEGFRWLQTLRRMGFGGILADEMGLGKTLQVIALLLAVYGEGKDASEQAPTLIVCPASLVYNWTAELARFAPQLRTAAVAGTPAQRQAARTSGAQVLVTSYDSLRADAREWEALPLQMAVLDEAHYIKNHATKTARAAKRLQAQWRLALTGTPVENRPAELWSIFDFLMPGFLGTAMRFRERFEVPVIGGDEGAARRLSALVGPFILRRLKRDVLPELPPKLETVLEVPLTGEQRKLYAAAEQSLRERLNLQKNTRKARRYGYEVKGWDGGEFKMVEVLAELTRLRQIALDPALVFENYQGTGAKRAVILERVAAAIDAGQKTLIFSQFTSFLDLVAQDLHQQGIPFFAITGATPKRQRVQLVEAFNQGDVPVFLVSLRAGGVGLNLTGAAQVIHADPWWNASAQNQASDRAHRFGQQQVVNVCSVVAAGTIEARMIQLQETKAQLAQLLVGESAGEELFSLTPELLEELLG